MQWDFSSKVFETQVIRLGDTQERIVRGGRDRFALLPQALAAGFTEENGTLGEMFAVIRESDMVLLLIADAAQGAQYKEIFAALKPGATLGLSHGFLLGHLENEDAT